MAKNLRVRLLAAATVNGKRSYYKPAMRSTGWPDGGAVLVKGRKVRIDASQLHAYYVTWLEGKKQQFENVGKDALSAWQAKLTREASLNGVAGAAEQVAKSTGKRVTVADAVEVFLEDVKAGKSVKTHLARKRMLALFQESCSKQLLDQITEADCQQFIRFLRKRYDSAKGARTVYNVFQGLNTLLRANKVSSRTTRSFVTLLPLNCVPVNSAWSSATVALPFFAMKSTKCLTKPRLIESVLGTVSV